MPKEAFDYLSKNSKRISWNCDCAPEGAESVRSLIRIMKKVDNLQEQVHKEMSDMKALIELNRKEINDLKILNEKSKNKDEESTT